jgi:predicted RND superfamily exporter protein
MSHLGLLLSIELAWTVVCTLVVLPAVLACVRPSNAAG